MKGHWPGPGEPGGAEAGQQEPVVTASRLRLGGGEGLCYTARGDGLKPHRNDKLWLLLEEGMETDQEERMAVSDISTGTWRY